MNAPGLNDKGKRSANVWILCDPAGSRVFFALLAVILRESVGR